MFCFKTYFVVFQIKKVFKHAKRLMIGKKILTGTLSLDSTGRIFSSLGLKVLITALSF